METGQEHVSNNAEALAGVAYAAVASDREIKDIEVIYLQAIFSRKRLFEGWTVADYKALFRKLQNILDVQGLKALLEMSIRRLPETFYRSAFAIAVDLVLADGVLKDEEEEFLRLLQGKLLIDNALASQITEVIVIKNQC